MKMCSYRQIIQFNCKSMNRILTKIGTKNLANLAQTHPYAIGIVLVVLLTAIALFFIFETDSATEEAEDAIRVVSTIDVSTLAEGAAGIAYPTASHDTYVVRAEASGRVERAVTTGSKVAPGAIIAEIENASARAALTQAQGAYEAARAGAAQSDIGVTDARAALTAAKQNAIATDRAALSAFLNALYNTIDELFTNPRTLPGVRIDASGQAPNLNQARLELQTAVTNWEREIASVNEKSGSEEILALLNQSSSRVSSISSVINTFVTLLSKQKADDILTPSELARLSGEFSAAQVSINSQIAALASVKVAVQRAEEEVNSATIRGTGGEISAADATIKQALGAYQAAQANYNKTLVRAPFAGTITAQNLNIGDIINIGTDVALIKPDNGVETTRWWHLPLAAVKYTPDNAYVFVINNQGVIEGIAVETGLVTAGDLRVTGITGSEVVVADVRGLKVGDKVVVENK